METVRLQCEAQEGDDEQGATFTSNPSIKRCGGDLEPGNRWCYVPAGSPTRAPGAGVVSGDHKEDPR